MAEEDREDDSYVEIDKYHLDDECQRQPKLVKREGERLATLEFETAEAKAALDLKKAQLELGVRSDPAVYDLEKVTEATVAAAIVALPDYQRALKRYNKARKREAVQKALVEALKHKKPMIERMIDLFLAGYYAEPKAKGDARAVTDGASKRSARKPVRKGQH